MFGHTAEILVEKLINNGTVQKENKQIYQYGVNQIFNNLLSFISFSLIAVLLKAIPESLVFLAAYIPLRVYAGGYHAKTPLRCWILSNLLLSVVILIVCYASISQIWYDIFSSISVFLILFFIPVESYTKPLDEEERNIFRKHGRVILFFEVIIFFFLHLFAWNKFAEILAMVWISLSILLLIGKRKLKQRS